MTVLELLGALGVFLFGMKLMSEGLQKVAGDRMKALLGAITGNRFAGALTGVLVTCVVQSSSATTVMVVGFVSAGLLSLAQSIGVIMGANIGTTFTGWLVALLGFKVKITAFALPAVGAGFAMTFLQGARIKQWGEVLIGFGLLFIGLGLLKDAVPSIDDPGQLTWVADLSSYGFLSVLIFVFIGTLLTVVLQSSSATMTLTLTLAAMGWLPYELAAAMVLGENIGTTATANLAAIGAPVAARRAARAHFVFNLVGVVWFLCLLEPVVLPTVAFLVPGDFDPGSVDFQALQSDPLALAGASGAVTVHIAALHTLFNVSNTVLQLPFVNQLERLVTRWVPDDDEGRAPSVALQYLGAGNPLVETPELVLLAAGRELQRMVELVRVNFDEARYIVAHPDEDLGHRVAKVYLREQELDLLEAEILKHLALVARAATSATAARKVAELVQNTHRVERIGDHVLRLTQIAQRVHDKGHRFSRDDLGRIEGLCVLVDGSLEHVGRYLAGEGDPRAAEAHEELIDLRRNQLHAETVERITKGEEGLQEGLALMDALARLEEIGDRAIGIIRRAEETRDQ